MRYSTLASAVLLAAAAAPALAHPVTIRATEDASIIERELQDGLVDRGYYDDLASRDLEARRNPADRAAKQMAANIKKNAGKPKPHRPDVHLPSGQARHADSGPRPSHPHPNRARSDEIVERDLPGRKGPKRPIGPPPLHPGPDPRPRPRSDYYDIVARDLEARRQPPRPPRPVTPPPPAPRPWAPPRPATPYYPRPRGDNEWFAREYDVDGELFERGFEIDELD